MSNVYLMDEGSQTTKLTRVSCKDENKELQTLLERNLNLLPGDQIDPETKLRWLLIKREMPVINPASGLIWWSIDFFLVDQLGIPTLVECKRCNDTKARREVVGQMFEYAANGRHYWSASDMRSHAQTAAGGEEELANKLKELTESQDVAAEEFFALVEQNLNSSKMRLIFFLDDSPLELRSVVEFLNSQMKDTEVLIVEARQYQQGGSRIVVPWLFGFTEEARVAKRESKAESVRALGPKGEEPFWLAIASALSDQVKVQALRALIEALSSAPGCKVVWQRSFILMLPVVNTTRGLFGIRRDGYLELYLSYGQSVIYPDLEPREVAVRRQFALGLEALLHKPFSEKQQNGFPQIAPEKWIPIVPELTQLVMSLGIEGLNTSSTASTVALPLSQSS